MKKLLLLALIIGSCHSAFTQSDIFKFKVLSAVSRIKLSNGEWDKWLPFTNVNRTMAQNITIDLEGRKLLWETQYKDDPPKIHRYTIKDVSNDTAYMDFGMWMLTLVTQNENSEDHIFKILFAKNESSSYYIMLSGSNVIQSKYYLEYIRSE